MQTSEQSHTTQLEGFDDFVGTVMQDWKLPGIALAIVKDGEVIYAQGFGKRDVAKGLDVTPNTLFPIGSCTKAFTTMVMGMLVDEGKLDWEKPVKDYLPTFKMHDTMASERMTPFDLVTHRSGLPRHDFVWYRAHRTRQELFDRLQYLEPSKDFRSAWQYQNLMYMTAGYLAGQIAGQSWEHLVQEHIFQRLDMTSSLFTVQEAQQKPDFSLPYREEKDEVHEIPFYDDFEGIAPAGAIVSNVLDMSKWLFLHLNKGKLGDTQIISEAQLTLMQSPQMVIPDPRKHKEVSSTAYGLGWATTTYRGHYMLQHSGGIDGFSALATLLPDDNIGIVALSNMSGCPVHNIVTLNACDRLLGLDAAPWNERGKKEMAELKAIQEQSKAQEETDRVPDTHPSHALKDYTGDFEHPGYGTLVITLDNDQLQMTFGAISFALAHYHYDFFQARLERYDLNVKASFTTNLKGDIDSVTIPFEPMIQPITFKRRASKEMSDKSFLEQFVGTYEVSGFAITITLKGDKMLFMSVPGQPEYELQPYKDMTFQLKGLTGFSVDFKRDEGGPVIEAILHQPQGVISAKKQ